MSATTLLDSPLFNRTAIKPFDLRARAGQLATWLTALVLLAAAFFAGPASAAVDLRVESRPIGNPIEAYVTVTDAAGQSGRRAHGRQFHAHAGRQSDHDPAGRLLATPVGKPGQERLGRVRDGLQREHLRSCNPRRDAKRRGRLYQRDERR